MIRIVVVDDHPALRIGLAAVLESEPGLKCVGVSDGRAESLWPLLERTDPDVVILDYHLPHENGLVLCHRMKHRVPTPRVVLYSAYATPGLLLPATVAGADALLDKGAGARELHEAVRLVYRGRRPLLDAPGSDRLDALGELDGCDRRVLELLCDGGSEQEVERAVGLRPGEVAATVERALEQMRPEAALTR